MRGIGKLITAEMLRRLSEHAGNHERQRLGFVLKPGGPDRVCVSMPMRSISGALAAVGGSVVGVVRPFSAALAAGLVLIVCSAVVRNGSSLMRCAAYSLPSADDQPPR